MEENKENLPAPVGHSEATLISMAGDLERMEDLLADPNFDPEKFIGDLKGKVDGTKYILDAQEDFRAFLQTRINPIQKKATQIGKNWDKLKQYVTRCLRVSGGDQLPGSVWKVSLRENKPKLIQHREATVNDFLIYGEEYVEQFVAYRWRGDALLADALVGKIKLEDNRGSEPKEGECRHPRQIRHVDEVQANVLPGKCEDCGAVLPPRSNMPLSVEYSWWPDFRIKVPEKLDRKPKSKGKTNGKSAKGRATEGSGADVPQGTVEQDHKDLGSAGGADQGCATGTDAEPGRDAPIQADRAD